MARNVEIKARVRHWGELVERVERLAPGGPELQVQEDTFYRCASGRLKLRVLAPDRGDLIYYQRDDAAGPKTSRYLVSPTQEPSSLADVLAMALGVRGVVRKERLLYWVGPTRVHMDQVDGLGAFVELEVVLEPGQSEAEGREIARGLMETLDIRTEDLVSVAYIDLLQDG
jgi:predicted adenylyl cyclase CyaB